MAVVAVWLLPGLLCCLSVLLLCGRRNLFDAFLQGASEGIKTAGRLLPTLVALLVGIGMLRACGFLDFLVVRLSPLMMRLGVPGELLPLLLIRPLSGGGSTALASELFAQYGADSFVGRCASVLMGASDTVFYVVAVYLGAAGVRHGRHTLLVALFTSIFAVFFSCFLCRLLF